MADEILSAANRAVLTPLSAATLDQLRYTTPENVKYLFADRLALASELTAQNNCGYFSPALLPLSTNPTHTDTVTIGGEVYEFINTSTGTAVADDDNIAVTRGANAGASVDNLIAAINGTAGVHGTITLADTTTPARSVGTLPLFALKIADTNVGLFYTGTQGKSPFSITRDEWSRLPATIPSIALSNALTASVAWTTTNLNLVPFFNPAISVVSRSASVRVTITAAMIAAGLAVVAFGVGLGSSASMAMHITCMTSAGVLKVPATDSFTLSQTTGILTIALNDGTGDLDAGDIVQITVVSNLPV